MKIFTSYFYKVRFMNYTMLPMSTAVWDPKWFHDFKDQDHTFFDKHAVFNGARIPFFAPDFSCRDLCRGRTGCDKDYSTCDFLSMYRKQLDHLDINAVLSYMKAAINRVQRMTKYSADMDIILLLHEAADNPCSERVPIQEWFASHDIAVTELCI